MVFWCKDIKYGIEFCLKYNLKQFDAYSNTMKIFYIKLILEKTSVFINKFYRLILYFFLNHFIIGVPIKSFLMSSISLSLIAN